VNPSLAPPADPAQLVTAESLAALSTADCLVDAGPVPGLAYAPCADDDGCLAIGCCHVAYEDCTDCPREGDTGLWPEGDWCALHARGEVLRARELTAYVDVEVRTPVTTGAESAA
jgi:hypothetical protein